MTAAPASATPAAPARSGTRAAAWAGIAFFVLFPVGTIFVNNSLDNKDSNQKWHDWYADSGNRIGNVIGIYMLVVAAILFVVFASALLERLRTAGGPSTAHRVAATTGAAFAILTVVAAIQMGGISGNITFGDTPVPKDSDIMRQSLGYGTLAVGAVLMVIAFILAVTTMAKPSGLFPNWLVIVSYVFAVILLGAVVFFPMVVLPIWVLLVSIVMLTRWSRV